MSQDLSPVTFPKHVVWKTRTYFHNVSFHSNLPQAALLVLHFPPSSWSARFYKSCSLEYTIDCYRPGLVFSDTETCRLMAWLPQTFHSPRLAGRHVCWGEGWTCLRILKTNPHKNKTWLIAKTKKKENTHEEWFATNENMQERKAFLYIDYLLHLNCQWWIDHESFHLVKILSQIIALKA